MSKYAFAIDHRKLGETIDELHRRFHDGSLVPQAVSYTENHALEDFTIKTFSLTYPGEACVEESGESTSG
jgi:hypothetical protein